MEADKNARIIQKNIREAAGCKIIYSLLQSRRQYNLLVALENTDERVYVADIARSESCAGSTCLCSPENWSTPATCRRYWTNFSEKRFSYDEIKK